MAAFAFLIVGVVCALISRVLLFTAALNISVVWAVGVLLPFGPVLFRLNYPDDAYRSRLFRFATLPCFFLYFLLGPGPAYKRYLSRVTQISVQPGSYAVEKAKTPGKQVASASGPTVETTPSLEEQRLTNTGRFEQLRKWDEALRLKKRDLLHSNTDGNMAYAAELTQYHAVLERAKSDRAALWPVAK